MPRPKSRAPTKRPATKKVVARKVVVRKAAPRKAAAKKPAARTMTARKVPPKRLPPRKVAKRAPAKKAPAALPSPSFQALIEVFLERPGVSQASMMGCQGLRVASKYFAMEWRGELVVKLPRDTVDAYAAAGRGAHFDPGMGRPMKEWLSVPPGVADWRHLAEQAFGFVAASL